MRGRLVAVAAVGLGVALAPSVAHAAPLAPGSGNHPELQDRGPRYCGPGMHVDVDGWTCIRDWEPQPIPVAEDSAAQQLAEAGSVILFGLAAVALL